MATKEPNKDQPQSAPTPTGTPERIEFRPNPKVHLVEAGDVALSNWVGRVGDRRVRVYRGAPAKKIPDAVQKAMAESGVLIGRITLEELGLRSVPGRQAGARIVSVTD
jgi:hypothetical protein